MSDKCAILGKFKLWMGRRRQPRPEEKADSKHKRPQEKTQELLQDACVFHHSQHTLLPSNRLSIQQTALKFNVSYFTLRNRIKGLHQNAHQAHESQQSLSIIQERIVVEWLNELSNQSVPLSKWTLQKKVQDITGGCIRPGRQWITRFLAWHPMFQSHDCRKSLQASWEGSSWAWCPLWECLEHGWEGLSAGRREEGLSWKVLRAAK